MENEELVKSLTQLIDETLDELEELKKSKFAAAEIKMDGPGENLNSKNAGKAKDVNGGVDKADEEDEEEDEDETEAEEAEKAEKDPAAVDIEMKSKKRPPMKQSMDDKAKKAKDMMAKEEAMKGDLEIEVEHEDDDEDEKEEKKDKKDKKEMKKSIEETEALFKSYVDERVGAVEGKLDQIFDLINKIADQPQAPKGATARFQPLKKSESGEREPLTKSEITTKLLELKKSGANVNSDDVVRADLGFDLNEIAAKYNLGN